MLYMTVTPAEAVLQLSDDDCLSLCELEPTDALILTHMLASSDGVRAQHVTPSSSLLCLCTVANGQTQKTSAPTLLPPPPEQQLQTGT